MADDIISLETSDSGDGGIWQWQVIAAEQYLTENKIEQESGFFSRILMFFIDYISLG